MNKKHIYITPECELTAYYAEPLMSISNPIADENFRAEEGLNKTEAFDATEEGFWD